MNIKEIEEKLEDLADKIKDEDSVSFYKDATKLIKKFGGKNIEFIQCDHHEDLENTIIEIINKRKSKVFIAEDPYHDLVGWTLHGYVIFEEKHSSDYKQLAENISNLSYDALCQLLKELSVKIKTDSITDKKKERKKLSGKLLEASEKINEAWQICKPYMNS